MDERMGRRGEKTKRDGGGGPLEKRRRRGGVRRLSEREGEREKSHFIHKVWL